MSFSSVHKHTRTQINLTKQLKVSSQIKILSLSTATVYHFELIELHPLMQIVHPELKPPCQLCRLWVFFKNKRFFFGGRGSKLNIAKLRYLSVVISLCTAKAFLMCFETIFMPPPSKVNSPLSGVRLNTFSRLISFISSTQTRACPQPLSARWGAYHVTELRSKISFSSVIERQNAQFNKGTYNPQNWFAVKSQCTSLQRRAILWLVCGQFSGRCFKG